MRRLRDLLALPGLELVRVDDEHEDGEQKTVPHVENADNLNKIHIGEINLRHETQTSEMTIQTRLSHQTSTATKTVPRM